MERSMKNEKETRAYIGLRRRTSGWQGMKDWNRNRQKKNTIYSNAFLVPLIGDV